MATRIKIQPSSDVQEDFVKQVREWTNETLKRKGLRNEPPSLCINIWKTLDELRSFYQQEKQELGVVTGEETEFLATHEAWRGYPRIHVCEERVRDVPDAVLQGVLHHEISHAFHHGSPEFYTFRYSNRLQEAARRFGLDLRLLQQCVYLLSVAIKDYDVVTWLADIGLGFSQLNLLEYMIADTEAEQRVWEAVFDSPAQRKLALAAFLKTLLPIEALVSAGIERAAVVKNQWSEAYFWLSKETQERLVRFAHNTMIYARKPFQECLEYATFRLITEPYLDQ